MEKINKNLLYIGAVSAILVVGTLFFFWQHKRRSIIDFRDMYDVSWNILSECSFDGEVVYSKYANQNESFTTTYYKDLSTGEVYQISKVPSENPKWSPNGKDLIFVQLVDGTLDFDIYLWDKEVKTEYLLLSLTNSDEGSPVWSEDGNQILFKSGMDNNNFDIFLYDFASEEIQGVVSSESYASEPSWSTDQQRIAYTSNDSDNIRSSQIYINDINGDNKRQLTESVQNQYDENPIWCLDDSCVIFERHIYSQNDPVIELMIYDLESEQVNYFINPKLFPNEHLYNISLSATGRYITFRTTENFYVIDYKSQSICPLNIQAVELTLYP